MTLMNTKKSAHSDRSVHQQCAQADRHEHQHRAKSDSQEHQQRTLADHHKHQQHTTALSSLYAKKKIVIAFLHFTKPDRLYSESQLEVSENQ